MLYALLRSVAGVALRWYYRRIEVEGLDRLPTQAPLLLVVNHPNALVDALLVGWVIPRRVTLTAKSTLFENRFLARLLCWLGVVPLVRTSDVRHESGATGGVVPDLQRNARAFGALRRVLYHGGAVVIFPEGISHDSPSLAPLRTGAARIALEARDDEPVRNLHIVPIGLTFERKDTPRTRVVVQIGNPISMDEWGAGDDSAVIALTREIETRLRAVTLNYTNATDAARAAALSSLLASLVDERLAPLGPARNYAVEVSLARRIEAAERALMQSSDDQLRMRADRLVQTLAAFEQRLKLHRVSIDDVRISTEGGNALPFVLREGWLIAAAGPVALWGYLNHWIPFHAARAIALRRVESAADPAMRTILVGTALVLAGYLVQGLLVFAFAGWSAALLYVVSLPLAADVNFLMRERLRRARARARTYFLFRGRPKLKASLQQELRTLRLEALEIERQLERLNDAAATA